MGHYYSGRGCVPLLRHVPQRGSQQVGYLGFLHPVAQADDRANIDPVEQSAVSSPSSTGVLPLVTVVRAPPAGFRLTTWPTISQSNGMRIAARCCLTVGVL